MAGLIPIIIEAAEEAGPALEAAGEAIVEEAEALAPQVESAAESATEMAESGLSQLENALESLSNEAPEPVTTCPSEAPAPSTGPVGDIDPAEVANKTPEEIHDYAVEQGLEPKGPDPQNGRGSYIDPQTNTQRILSHPEADPPHAHVNNPAGERLDINGNVVPAESPEAHLPINTGNN